MKVIFVMMGLMIASKSIAEMTSINVPELNLSVRFDAIPANVVEETNTPSRYYYIANAGRYNISLTVEDPLCDKGMTVEDSFKCIVPKIESTPGFVKETFSSEIINKGIKMSYISYGPVDKKLVKILNTHILFSDNGKWADLHASVILPTQQEMLMLIRLGDQFDYTYGE